MQAGALLASWWAIGTTQQSQRIEIDTQLVALYELARPGLGLAYTAVA